MLAMAMSMLGMELNSPNPRREKVEKYHNLSQQALERGEQAEPKMVPIYMKISRLAQRFLAS